MNLLLFGDLHLTQQDLPECIQILEEIGMLANQHKVDLVIDLGDTFDNLKPSSLELDCFATFIRRLNKKLIIIAADSHESETEKQSILNHYGILNDTIIVVKEYQDDYLLCLHEFIKENNLNFGAKRSLKDFKQFKYVFSGHDHHYHIIKPNYCFLGSCRFINFDEAKDSQKVIAIIEDYRGEKEKVIFIPLNSPIPMMDIELEQNSQKQSVKDPTEAKKVVPGSSGEKIHALEATVLALCQKLDKLPEKNKVRIIFKDYSLWVEFLPYYQKYVDKFILFKQKKDFIMNCNLAETKPDNLTLKESLINWMEKNQVNEKIRKILLEELK